VEKRLFFFNEKMSLKKEKKGLLKLSNSVLVQCKCFGVGGKNKKLVVGTKARIIFQNLLLIRRRKSWFWWKYLTLEK